MTVPPSSHRDAHPYGRSSDDVRRRELRVRRTRRLRAVQLAIFSLLVIVLIGVGVYAVGEFRRPSAEQGVIAQKSFGEEEAEVTCPDPGAVPLPPGDVTVTVLNGTSRGGLAGEVTEQLGSRGFTMGDAGNTKKADSAVTIVYGPDGYLAAQSVRTQVPDAALRLDDREGAEVDLLLGNGFSEIAPEDDAAAALEDAVEMPEGCPTE
ncbi:hypothetical protein CIK66_01540 [Brachybacterium alimentarium]|uniref:LytR/CpsA/Psr regulator C-terminal domain-containing protein n=1 Tax=Brachybacterium alimentarium TaxID=47845 RepID=A0A2A3YNT6_9MICO|nr:LytR C-terminal domain-containing protein [Brachybacterium alimentarium]PCC40943.1 hypothetical protein CIK66_01540 [Brachybacterium alimentarium]